MGRTIWPASPAFYRVYQRSRSSAAAEDRLFITGLPPACKHLFCRTAAERTRSAKGGGFLLCWSDAARLGYDSSARACRSLGGDGWTVGPATGRAYPD